MAEKRETKRCPNCAEDIMVEAKVCRHCGSALTDVLEGELRLIAKSMYAVGASMENDISLDMLIKRGKMRSEVTAERVQRIVDQSELDDGVVRKHLLSLGYRFVKEPAPQSESVKELIFNQPKRDYTAGGKKKASNFGAINIASAIVLLIIAIFVFFNLGRGNDAEEANVDDQSTSSSTSSSQRYENLSDEGQAYVDEEMRKYDEFCARSTEC